MAAITICSDFGAPKNKVCLCFRSFPSICHEVMGLDAMTLVFWMLSFKPAFSLSSYTFIKRLFRSSLLSALSEVVDIPPGKLDSSCASSSPAFRMRYSAYKLNKQGDNIHPWCTPFPILNQSVVLYIVYIKTIFWKYRKQILTKLNG